MSKQWIAGPNFVKPISKIPTLRPDTTETPLSPSDILIKVKKAETFEQAQHALVANYKVPDIASLAPGKTIDSLPCVHYDPEVITNPLSGPFPTTTPISSLGTRFCINPKKSVPSHAISNISFRKLKDLVYLEKDARDSFLQKWLDKHNHSDFALNVFHTLNATENTTQRSYFRKLIQLEEFFHNRFPQDVEKLDFTEILTSPKLKRMLIVFLHHKSKENVALTTLQSYIVAINFARKIIGLGTVPGYHEISTAAKALGRLRCLRPKGTAAIPVPKLRLFFKFLRFRGVRTYTFFALAFWAGSRASEAANINTESFFFFRTTSGRKAVKLTFFRPKTKKKYKDDKHIVIFTNSPDQFNLCPYKMACWFCQNHPENTYLLPFPAKSKRGRQARLYTWFKSLKNDFHNWHFNEYQTTISTKNWTFHSFRTTLIAVLRNAGLSWEQIQLRVGHKLDSKTTKEVYYLNALLTEGFDKDFDKILSSNKDICDLMESPAGIPLSITHQGTVPNSTRSPTKRSYKKPDRRFRNFRRKTNKGSPHILVRHSQSRTSATRAYTKIRKKYFG